MDVDIDSTGLLQGNYLMASSQCLSNATLPGGGLMRYHSAPSSVLAGLLDEDVFPASDDSEFVRLLSDGIGSFSSLLDLKSVHQHIACQPDFNALDKDEDLFLSHAGRSNKHRPEYLGGGSSFQERLAENPLSAISEYGLGEAAEDFCMPLPSQVVEQVPLGSGHFDGTSYRSRPVAQSPAIPLKSAHILQSNSPADTLVMAENYDRVNLGCGLAGSGHPVVDEKLVAQSIGTSQVTIVNTFSDRKCGKGLGAISSPRRPTALLRQSSSPAGLLSQVNVEDFMVIKGSMHLECTDSMSGRKGLTLEHGRGFRSGDDNLCDRHFDHLGQRKRGRGLDEKLVKGLQRSSVDIASVSMSSLSPPSSSCPGSVDCLEGPGEESVLCKARAKRGCATHPRSIAERQRRIKISERMKKLQDLVPNLDRQASTAEMLDEVVEYVKLLQQQVQELSLNRPTCTGSCQQGSNSPT